jgi:uncharacterized protein
VTVASVFTTCRISSAQVDLPMPRYYVEDYANVINNSDEQALNGVLQELEQKTGAQYIILTVETTGGVPIEEFSIKLAEKWKLGRKGKDNGLLFTIAVKDRWWRFEVGYGLEGFVTDNYCGQVGRQYLVPYLKKGDYSRGIYQANLVVVRKIAGAAGVSLSGLPRLPPQPTGIQGRRGGGLMPWWSALPGLLLIVVVLVILWKGPWQRGSGPFIFWGFRGPGDYSGGGSLGRSSFGGFGGGFGGFGGGMGGHFGGGGASGRW